MADGGGPSRKRARAEGSSDEDAARRPPNEGEPITSTSEPAEDGSDQQPDAPPELRGATRFAMVCASNMNRSMEAHHVVRQAGLVCSSYGIGNHVKLPGPSQREPNVYDFGTPYAHIRADLRKKDAALYTRNGLLKMLDRNVKVKRVPERFQESFAQHDVIVCFEQRVFDICVETLNARENESMESVLVLNLQTPDNAEEAAKAGQATLALCEMLEAADDWEEEIEDILDAFVEKTGRRPLYCICFY